MRRCLTTATAIAIGTQASYKRLSAVNIPISVGNEPASNNPDSWLHEQKQKKKAKNIQFNANLG
jgi:hypothetical protein